VSKPRSLYFSSLYQKYTQSICSDNNLVDMTQWEQWTTTRILPVGSRSRFRRLERVTKQIMKMTRATDNTATTRPAISSMHQYKLIVSPSATVCPTTYNTLSTSCSKHRYISLTLLPVCHIATPANRNKSATLALLAAAAPPFQL